MDGDEEDRRSQFASWFVRVAATFLIATASIILCGWIFDIRVLKNPAGTFGSMRANTAASFLMCGVALWALSQERRTTLHGRIVAACGALVVAIASITALEHLLGQSLGIDGLLLPDVPAGVSRDAAARRVAPATTLGLLCGGVALLLVHSRASVVTGWLCALIALIGTLAAAGHLYGSPSLYAATGFSSISVPTALCLIVLAAGLVCTIPGAWILELMVAQSSGGILARRLLPAAIFVPLLFGWLRMLGQRAGYYDTWFGVAIFAVANVTGFFFLSLWTAASLHRADLRTRRLVEDLRSSQDRLRLIVEYSPGAVALFDNDMRYLMVSPRWSIAYGLGDQPLIGRSHYEVMPDLPERWRQIHRRCLAGAVERCEEDPFPRSDGSVDWVRWEIQPWRDAHGNIGGIIIFSEVVTVRKLAEEALQLTEDRLMQAQKMEAIGRLAGGVAHDFNNLLTAINGYSELLDSELEPGSRPKTYIKEIRRAGDRAASLTAQLLAYSRKQVLAPRMLDLDAAVSSIDPMLRSLLGERIEFVCTRGPGLGLIRADPTQVEQLILNIALNARDAMPDGGRLSIETANVTFDEDYVLTHPDVAPGCWVMIAITDTGTGMDEPTKARIFEPFFTTKGVGKGTGLGLSTVHGIVSQSGGHISVSSEPGSGSTFRVYFPRIDGPLDPTPGESEALPRKGAETILVVEDEAIVRRFIVDVLRGYGFDVLSMESPGEALAMAGKRKESIHLLVSDIVMPEVRGPELASRLAISHPETRTLFISGYNEDVAVHRGQLNPGVEFLPKPFTALALLAKVRAVLDAPRR